jgi:hypothetical protein
MGGPLCEALNMLIGLKTLDGMTLSPNVEVAQCLKEHPTISQAFFDKLPRFNLTSVPPSLRDNLLSKIWLVSYTIDSSRLFTWSLGDLKRGLNMGMRVVTFKIVLCEEVVSVFPSLPSNLFAPGILQKILVVIDRVTSQLDSTLGTVLGALQEKLNRSSRSSAMDYPDVKFSYRSWDDGRIYSLPLYPAALGSALRITDYSIGLRSSVSFSKEPPGIWWPNSCCIVQLAVLVKQRELLSMSPSISTVMPFLEDLLVAIDIDVNEPLISSDFIVCVLLWRSNPKTY